MMKRDLASGSLLIAGASGLATAGRVAYGWGCVAVMSAAVASGFVSPGVIARIVAAEGSRMPEAFLLYTGLWNQGFAKVNVVATSIGILLCRKRGAMPR